MKNHVRVLGFHSLPKQNGDTMRLTLRKLLLVFLCAYTIISCYTVYYLLRRRFRHLLMPDSRWERIRKLEKLIDGQKDLYPWDQVMRRKVNNFTKFEKRKRPPESVGSKEHQSQNQSNSDVVNASLQKTVFHVEIWGKAAIGLYFWEHILNGNLEEKLNGIWTYGQKQIGSIHFSFRSGPGVLTEKVPRETEYLILVLNGREEIKVEYSKDWLNFLPNLPRLKHVAVLLLGNEQCNNEWIKPYLKTAGGLVDFIFLVYDSPDIDNNQFYQWPLGVATYRNFPKIDIAYQSLNSHRKHMCNFLGTIYLNSSREHLIRALEKSDFAKLCNINVRKEWLPQETSDTRNAFVKALLDSDLTLCPVGINSECYRIYEAMSMGSVPVIEDRLTEGKCGPSQISKSAPFRLLKEEHAPVIFVKSWDEVADILKNEQTKTIAEKILRRQNVLQWYKNFKMKMQERFIGVIQERFFSSL